MQRVALIIGNRSYENFFKLRTPISDAEGVENALGKLGFTVDCRKDLTRNEMWTAVADITRSLRGASAMIFYYAGHGCNVGTNK